MADYQYLPVSNGSGDAPLMHIMANRSIGATVINVDTVTNVPSVFVATSGTLLASGFIDPTTKCDFKGHLSGSTLVIDGFEPGSVDNGNTSGQVVVIKPNTGWANRVANFIKNLSNNGTPELITPGGITNTGAATGIIEHLVIPCKFYAYRNSAYSLSNTTFVFDTKVFDTGNNYSTTTGLFTVPTTGYYVFTASVWVNTASGGFLAISVNGTSLVNLGPSDTSTGQNKTFSGTTPLNFLTVGQTVAVTTGGSFTIGTGLTTFFSGYMVGQA